MNRALNLARHQQEFPKPGRRANGAKGIMGSRVNPADGKPRLQIGWPGYGEHAWEPATSFTRFDGWETLGESRMPAVPALQPRPGIPAGAANRRGYYMDPYVWYRGSAGELGAGDCGFARV